MAELEKIFDVIKTIVSILAIFGVTFEILPIKISPLKWIGKRITQETNDKIDKIQKQVDNIEYNNDMKDLRTIKNRLHTYGRMIQNKEDLSIDTLKSALDDLDIYDYYKETYKYMWINGRKVKINGEIEVDRQLITNAMTNKVNKQ